MPCSTRRSACSILRQTIRENYLRLNPEDNENATARSALARFMFRNDAALKPVGQLSGGEMLRAGLACTIGSGRPPELLILDEPTNHLDIHAIEAVEAGLAPTTAPCWWSATTAHFSRRSASSAKSC